MDPVTLISGVVVAGTFYIFAYRRKGKVADARVGVRCIELTSPGTPADVFNTIAAIGPRTTSMTRTRTSSCSCCRRVRRSGATDFSIP